MRIRAAAAPSLALTLTHRAQYRCFDGLLLGKTGISLPALVTRENGTTRLSGRDLDQQLTAAQLAHVRDGGGLRQRLQRCGGRDGGRERRAAAVEAQPEALELLEDALRRKPHLPHAGENRVVTRRKRM